MTRIRSLGRPTSDQRSRAGLSTIRSSCGRVWFIILISMAIELCALAGPRVSKVRVGDHESFARLVFEMEGLAEVGDVRISSGRIWLPLLDTATELENMQLENGTIRSIEFVREGQTLNAGVEVTFDRFEHRLFALTEPDRIVLDVHPEQSVPLAVAEKMEIGPTEESSAPRTEHSRLNRQDVELGTTTEAEMESSSEVMRVDSAVREKETSTMGSLEAVPIAAESEQDVSAEVNWTPVGLVTLGLFLIGLLSIACVELLKKKEVVSEKSKPNEEFNKNIAAIDALIKKEIRNFDRLRWRKQE